MEPSVMLQLRSTAANVGEATRYALTAWADGNVYKAHSWEQIAKDLTYLGRAIARDSMTAEAVEAEAKAIYDRWDRLRGVKV